MNTYVIGVAWDLYTPAVEAQMAKDLIALKAEATVQRARLIVATEHVDADHILKALGIERINSMTPASIVRAYKVHSSPEVDVHHEVEIIECDLSVQKAQPNLYPEETPGYELKRGDQPIAPTVDPDKPAPVVRQGQIDPAKLFIWGP